jgi:hypothetical protein
MYKVGWGSKWAKSARKERIKRDVDIGGMK